MSKPVRKPLPGLSKFIVFLDPQTDEEIRATFGKLKLWGHRKTRQAPGFENAVWSSDFFDEHKFRERWETAFLEALNPLPRPITLDWLCFNDEALSHDWQTALSDFAAIVAHTREAWGDAGKDDDRAHGQSRAGAKPGSGAKERKTGEQVTF